MVVNVHKKISVYTINTAENWLFTAYNTVKYKIGALGDYSNHLLLGEMAPPYILGFAPRLRCTT